MTERTFKINDYMLRPNQVYRDRQTGAPLFVPGPRKWTTYRSTRREVAKIHYRLDKRRRAAAEREATLSAC